MQAQGRWTPCAGETVALPERLDATAVPEPYYVSILGANATAGRITFSANSFIVRTSRKTTYSIQFATHAASLPAVLAASADARLPDRLTRSCNAVVRTRSCRWCVKVARGRMSDSLPHQSPLHPSHCH